MVELLIGRVMWPMSSIRCSEWLVRTVFLFQSTHIHTRPVFSLHFLPGLSLLGYPGLVDLDPVYCMPASVIDSKGLRKDWLALERRSSL